MYTFRIGINRCWDGRRVSNVSTSRSFKVTPCVKFTGVGWDGYLDDTKFYYSLNGVGNAAYRYTQIARWHVGHNWSPSYSCDAVLTVRVYGDGGWRTASARCQ